MDLRTTSRPHVALVAHDGCKEAMGQWAAFNHGTLARCDLFATATTGAHVRDLGLTVQLLLSGPYGGDAQIGAMIAERRLDAIVFFWDALTTQPHDVDVKALLRLAVLYDIPTACNRSSADFLISSPLFFDRLYRAQRFAAAV